LGGSYYTKLTTLFRLSGDLEGVYCPLQLPSDSPLILGLLANGLIWDGFYKQTQGMEERRAADALKRLGVTRILESDGNINVHYENLTKINMPFVHSDRGNFVERRTNGRRKEFDPRGVLVAGTERASFALPIMRLLPAFELDFPPLDPHVDVGWHPSMGAPHPSIRG